MKIIAHRGYWITSEEKNTITAFKRAIEHGFGIETDIRDYDGEIVISHDMPARTTKPIALEYLLEIFGDHPEPLALNIKSDGLAKPVAEAMQKHPTINWFVFDMSTPEMRMHIRENNPTLTRLSEIEKTPLWPEATRGIWLDAFETDWYDRDFVKTILDQQKPVCIVSPELHTRNHLNTWSALRPLNEYENLILCTDHPLQARDYFRSNA
jgi:glycerophosphoryl diester phosphodiesterase